MTVGGWISDAMVVRTRCAWIILGNPRLTLRGGEVLPSRIARHLTTSPLTLTATPANYLKMRATTAVNTSRPRIVSMAAL